MAKNVAWLQNFHLIDANGEEIYAIPPQIEGLPSYHWGFQFQFNQAYPLTISFEGISTTRISDSKAELEFDVGENPQPGQEWVLNQPLEIGERTIMLKSIQVDSRGGYEFNFDGDPDVTGISVQISGYTALGGGGGGAYGFGYFSASKAYETLPTGQLNIVFSNLEISTLENWEMQWASENPLPAEESISTPEPEACLTLDKWTQLKAQDEPLAFNLSGNIVALVNEGEPLPSLYLSNPDGSDAQKIATGAWPSLSHDGQYLDYRGDNGIYVINLASEEYIPLGIDAYGMIWSPDDTRMMFISASDLYVVNADGSGLQQINTEPTQLTSSIGWLDNQTIVYGIMSIDGFNLQKQNLQSGETTDLFKIDNKAGYGSVSPDGQWIVFADRISAGVNWGIFISHLDGSDRKLIAEPRVPTAFISIWSPDSRWLVVNTLATGDSETPILVNPFTCETARLGFYGMVGAWGW